MSSKNKITFQEAADFIFEILPKELVEKPIKDSFRRPTTFKEEFLKQAEEEYFDKKTVFTKREDLERAVFCILEDWQKGREKFDGGLFDPIFVCKIFEEDT